MATITDTLAERGNNYGKFIDNAAVAQALKNEMKFAMLKNKQYAAFEPDQVECIEMICHKLARIANGDPNYVDSWHDIAGYATLVAERLSGNSK